MIMTEQTFCFHLDINTHITCTW